MNDRIRVDIEYLLEVADKKVFADPWTAAALTCLLKAELERRAKESDAGSKGSATSLAVLRHLPPTGEEFEIKRILDLCGDHPRKEIYNAIGYFTRRGRLRRVAYGRYVVGREAGR